MTADRITRRGSTNFGPLGEYAVGQGGFPVTTPAGGDRNAPLHPQGTRTLEIPWLALVMQADPNWQQDQRMQVEDTRRPKVLQNWRHRGPYADD